jgi:excisionase family DNA binding protein
MKTAADLSNEKLGRNDISYCVTIPEAAKMMRVSRNHMYKLVRERQFPSIQLGRRRVISKLQLEKFLAQESE